MHNEQDFKWRLEDGIAGRREPVMVNRDRRMQENARTVMEDTEDCIEQSPKTEMLLGRE